MAVAMQPSPRRLGLRRALPWGSLTLGHAAPSTQLKLQADFTGTWIKDKAASDSMEAAMDLIHVGGLLRSAIKLLKGIRVTQDQGTFTMAVFSVLTWFKVTERYTMDGQLCRCRRRDFRRGGHEGRVQVKSPERLQLQLSWGDPWGGTGTDEFFMPHPDRLHVTSTINVGGKSASYTQVYKRKGSD